MQGDVGDATLSPTIQTSANLRCRIALCVSKDVCGACADVHRVTDIYGVAADLPVAQVPRSDVGHKEYERTVATKSARRVANYEGCVLGSLGSISAKSVLTTSL